MLLERAMRRKGNLKETELRRACGQMIAEWLLNVGKRKKREEGLR